MKRTKTLAILLGILTAMVACSKGGVEKMQQTDPLFGVWTDIHQNYILLLYNDSIFYIEDEMDGIAFKAPIQKQDNNTLTFEIPDNGSGTLARDSETHDITLTLNLTEDPRTCNIPAYNHLDLALIAPPLAETFLYDETMTNVIDTLRIGQIYPIVNGKEMTSALLLPDGRFGWISMDRLKLTRSRLTPEFLEREYYQNLEDLRGHHDRTDTYSFKKLDNDKVAVLFRRIFINGGPAQESYYIGDLEGIHLNVNKKFNNWEDPNVQSAVDLDKPFDITLIDCVGDPYIETGRRKFQQIQPEY